ncbi:MAG: YitT family protein [Parasporobacterium sp.]|nr:YitT family protein [Parasporobacterium sp.]
MKINLKLRNFIIITIAGIINALGVTLFLMPVKLYDSGVSGLSMFLAQMTPEWMSLSLFLVIINIPLFAIGFKKQGPAFTIYSIYAVLIYSLGSWLITDVLPIDVNFASPLAGSDLLLCAIFGGMISGLGSGMVIRFGGAIDGVEVMAVIFAKPLGISVGTFVMIFNVILYLVCGFVMKSWILPLYSIVTYMAALKTVDFVVEGIDRSKSMMIVTENPEAICSMISEEFRQGITVIPAKGYYSDTDRSVIYVVLNRFQIPKARNLIMSADSSAFISISDVADIYKRAG